MDAPALTTRLHEHRMWANHKLLAAAGELSDEQLRRELPIGQGSVWKSLLHMYAAEYVWLETVLGNASATCPGDVPGRLPGNQAGEGGITTLGELTERWAELDSRWRAHLATLTGESLDETFYSVSTSSNGGQKRATWHHDILLHVCTHAHYTTAQVVNMLRQLDVAELPDPMIITLARGEHPENG